MTRLIMIFELCPRNQPIPPLISSPICCHGNFKKLKFQICLISKRHQFMVRLIIVQSFNKKYLTVLMLRKLNMMDRTIVGQMERQTDRKHPFHFADGIRKWFCTVPSRPCVDIYRLQAINFVRKKPRNKKGF